MCTRNLVITYKKFLRANPDGIFITENLNTYQANLIKRLAQLKFDKEIEAYWTSDGRIFVKTTEISRKEIVTNVDDIASLEYRSHRQSMPNSQDYPPVLGSSVQKSAHQQYQWLIVQSNSARKFLPICLNKR